MKSTIALLLAVALLAGTVLSALADSAAPEAFAPVSYEEIKKESKVEFDNLDGWINTLAEKFECVNCKPLFRHLDTNGKYSYQCLQFQEATFKDRVRKYDLLPASESEEVFNWIYDCDFQKVVARCMLENESSAWKHWRTSVGRGLGKPPIPEIKRCPTLKPSI